ncbi:protein GLUTAMINE DUMPER 3-like [Curcuma longa]|uniref:protein GLUTAMINE DUMPER 3-like n=1 Tax=Curcuma longa TaxID=136217 RepID=UPI003D9E78F0
MTGAGFHSLSGEAPSTPPGGGDHSPWKSPVPYLFGGLAAMLGLIVFALLVLACSYWGLSPFLDPAETGEQHEEGKPSDDGGASPAALEDGRLLVIMAGDLAPSFIAVPMPAAALGHDGGCGEC